MNQILFSSFLIFVPTYSGQPDDKWDEFRQWKTKYNKQYSSVGEDVNRYIVWRANYDFVQDYNKDYLHSSFTVELNEFAAEVSNLAFL